MAWTEAMSYAAFGGRQVMAVDCRGRRLALYRLGDEVFATSDACPHMGASLAGGEVVDGHIECPLHYALFDIRTGVSDGSMTATPVRTFPARVERDIVYVDLPAGPEQGPQQGARQGQEQMS